MIIAGFCFWFFGDFDFETLLRTGKREGGYGGDC